jgi:CheY-like chemotaxis protein
LGELDVSSETIVLVAEDDDAHFLLVEKNLKRQGISSEIVRFKDGQTVIDFLFSCGDGASIEADKRYVLLLDVCLPKVDGIEILTRIKNDDSLSSIPVIMLSAGDDPDKIDACHDIGCSLYVTKPADYESFVEAIKKIAMLISVAESG